MASRVRARSCQLVRRCRVASFLCVALTAFAAQPLAQKDPPGRDTSLSIAAWNLQHKTEKEAAERSKNRQPDRAVWRNTFGSQRRTAAWRTRGATGIDADVIALQGITTINEVRRIFPARSHHLIVSRAALTRPPAPAAGNAANAAHSTLTAIAIRRRRGLRLTAQRHFLAPRLGRTSEFAPSLGLAVRLIVGPRRFVWLANITLNETCRPEQPPIPACDAERLALVEVERWLALARRSGDTVILAGSAAARLIGANKSRYRSPPTSAASPCTSQPLRLELVPNERKDTTTPRVTLSRQAPPKQSPCVALARLITR